MSWVTVSCPDEECGWSESFRWLEANFQDPGCWAEEEPPDECPDCGSTLSTDDAEPMDPTDVFELADEAFERYHDR